MCGALVMDSMPPATTTVAEPALITSETSPAGTPDCCNAARMAVAPSVGVGTPVNWPSMEPIAVRLAPTITTESDMTVSVWSEPLDYAPDAAVRQYSGAAIQRRSPTLTVAVKQLAADQHLTDFIRAGADLVQLGIAQNPAGREIVNVAIPPQRLHCFQRDLHRVTRGIQETRSRIDARLHPQIELLRDGVGERARGLQRGVHVGDLGLHDAEGADRRVELLALAHVGQGDVQRRLHQADRTA